MRRDADGCQTCAEKNCGAFGGGARRRRDELGAQGALRRGGTFFTWPRASASGSTSGARLGCAIWRSPRPVCAFGSFFVVVAAYRAARPCRKRRRSDLKGSSLCAGASQASCGSNVPVVHRQRALEDAIARSGRRPCRHGPTRPAPSRRWHISDDRRARSSRTRRRSRLFPFDFTSAVPVLPATSTSFIRATRPVPPSSFTTFQSPLPNEFDLFRREIDRADRRALSASPAE